MNLNIKSNQKILRQYTQRIDEIKMLNLEETSKFLEKIKESSFIFDWDKSSCDDCLEQVIQFYYFINREWGYIIQEKTKIDFIYHPSVLESETGIYENNGILIHRTNTIQDCFVLLHEFAHYLDRLYGFTSNPLAQECFPLIMEARFSAFKGNSYAVQSFYRHRKNNILSNYCNMVIEELSFIKGWRMKDVYSKSELNQIIRFLRRDSLINYLRYIWGMYYALEWEEQTKKELQKKL